LLGDGLAGKAILMMLWTFGTMFLRESYNSSLYSFMTTEKVPDNFPKNVKQLLNRTDYELLMSRSYNDRIAGEMFINDESKLPKRLFEFYWRVILRASFMRPRLTMDVIQNISKGIPAKASSYPTTSIDSYKEWVESGTETKLMEKSKKFSRFVVMCEANCDRKWGSVFLGMKEWHRVVSKENHQPFFSFSEFWIQETSTVATRDFPKFLAAFVQSGLYELSINRYRKIEQLKIMKNSRHLGQLGFNGGSLFSYVFYEHDTKKFEMSNVTNNIRPTTVSALTGAFILTGTLCLSAIAVLMSEVVANTILK